MVAPLPRRLQRLVTVCCGLCIATLLCFILYWARSVLIPVAVAMLLTFLLSPLVMRLNRAGLRRVPAVVLVVGAVCIGVVGMFWLVTTELQSLADELPGYQGTINNKVRQLREDASAGAFGKVRSSLEEVAREIQGPEKDPKQTDVPSKPTQPEPMRVRVVADEKGGSIFTLLLEPLLALSPALDALATAGLSLLLTIFMLINFEDLRNRFISFTSSSSVTVTTKAIDDFNRRISRYLLMQMIINGSFGISVAIGLYFIGVPYAPLWGLCAGVFRYVPYVGPWVAAALPLSLAVVRFDEWTPFLLTALLFVVLELVSNNILETILYGQGTGVSEVALLVAATFWTVIWGPLGLILAMPLTVCLVVLGKHVPALAFLDRLLGDEPPLEPHVKLVQRILAKDDLEAQEIIACASSQPSIFDEVFLPAAALVRKERRRHQMTAEQETLVYEKIRASLTCPYPAKPAATTEAADDPGKAPEVTPGERRLILGIPTHHEVDELTLHLLGKFLEPSGYRVEAMSTRTLPSEVISGVAIEQPDLVVLAVQPPGGLSQASYLCRQLRRKYPHLGILVAVWGYRRNLDDLIAKFRQAGANYVTTTFQGVLTHARTMAPVEPPPAPEPNPDLEPALT